MRVTDTAQHRAPFDIPRAVQTKERCGDYINGDQTATQIKAKDRWYSED